MFILYNHDIEKFETFTIEELLEMIKKNGGHEYDKYASLAQLVEAINVGDNPYEVEEDMPWKVGTV